jgi:hypothetical protein
MDTLIKTWESLGGAVVVDRNMHDTRKTRRISRSGKTESRWN